MCQIENKNEVYPHPLREKALTIECPLGLFLFVCSCIHISMHFKKPWILFHVRTFRSVLSS